MKISVVTVCFNESSTISDTVKSVLSQKFDDYEYIIMDGASTDGTLSIIDGFLPHNKLSYYSEPDTGLFNAMNKSLSRISGDYVIFMNSGDMFYDDRVLADISLHLNKSAPDILYGDVYRRCSSGNYIQTYKGTHFERMKMMLCGLAFCHQSQFTRSDIMRKYGFREDHRITADFDFIVRALSDGLSFKHIDRIICSFDHEGGISANKDNYIQMTIEDDASIRECFPLLYYITILSKKLFRLCFR